MAAATYKGEIRGKPLAHENVKFFLSWVALKLLKERKEIEDEDEGDDGNGNGNGDGDGDGGEDDDGNGDEVSFRQCLVETLRSTEFFDLAAMYAAAFKEKPRVKVAHVCLFGF